MLASSDRKRLRAIAHHLDPILMIGDSGLSSGVIDECKRALSDHELIKTKIHLDDRDDRRELGNQLCEAVEAEVVQRIGKTLVLYRENPRANPKLSNVRRYS